jgi:predicted small secreted protein
MEPVEPAFVAVALIYLLRETPSMKLLRITPIAILACALALTACANTVRGVGRDVKSTAKAVEDTVTKP